MSLIEQMTQPIVNDWYSNQPQQQYTNILTMYKQDHPFEVQYMDIKEGKNYANVNQYRSKFTDIGLTYDEFVFLLETRNVYKLMQNEQLVAIVVCRENGEREIIRISVWYSDMRNLAGSENAHQFIKRYADKYLKFKSN